MFIDKTAEGKRYANLWVIGLIIALYILSVALYVPGMP